jgi:hypothetical protein
LNSIQLDLILYFSVRHQQPNDQLQIQRKHESNNYNRNNNKIVGFEVILLLIALILEAARTSETLVNFYQTTRRYNPEDSHQQ